MQVNWSAGTCQVAFDLVNPDEINLAFWVRLRVVNAQTASQNRDRAAEPKSTRSRVRIPAPDSRILPVFYSDNYVTLAPAETLALTVSFRSPGAGGRRGGSGGLSRCEADIPLAGADVGSGGGGGGSQGPSIQLLIQGWNSAQICIPLDIDVP